MGGACTDSEIPLLSMLSHLFGEVEAAPQAPSSSVVTSAICPGDPVQRHCQVGSLAGAAHLK